MRSEEQSRTSQLKDRNIYAQTDQLYEPLRNALRKSSVSHSLLLTQMSFSRVAKNIRSLSPIEAEIIKNNLYIPVNKQLVPSRNLQKVLGKNFRAVDVNESVKQALTAEQFSKRHLGTTQEIIYEIKNEAAKNTNIYTSRKNMQHSIYTNTHIFRDYNKLVNQNNRDNPINLNQRQQQRQSQIIRYNQTSVNKQSPSNSNANIGLRADRFNTNNIYTQPQQQSVNLPQNNYKKKQSLNSKLYDFRASKVSDKSTRISRKSKDQYKYNLFSALDEPGNTHCRSGCFNNNEIIASKIEYNPWK